MIEEPQVREDGLCVQCLRREAVGDCFCSTACCRIYYSVAGTEDRRLQQSGALQEVLEVLDDWTSTRALIDKTGLGKQTLGSRLRQLTEKGLIESQRGPRNSKVYRRAA